MTLLLLLPLSLHSFFSPSLLSHSLFLFLSSETSLAILSILPFALLLSSSFSLEECLGKVGHGIPGA